MSYKKIVRFIFGITISISLCVLLLFLYMELVSDFRLENIVYHDFQLTSKPNHLEPTYDKESLKKILNHSFSYLGKGHQAFVFASDDGLHVIKFFRFWRLKPSKFMKALSYVPPFENVYEKYEKKRIRRLEKLFVGYEVANQYDKINSGLLFLHLDKTSDLNKTLILQDRYGFKHAVNLDDVCFAIQERAVNTKKVLYELLSKNEVEKCKVLLRQLMDLYFNEYLNGIIDQDHNILDNTGFTKDRAIRLDIGQLKKDDQIRIPANYLADLRKIIDKRLSVWLRGQFPKVAEELIEELEKTFEEIKNSAPA